MKKENEKEIIEQLENLPHITDETDKEKIYQRVAMQLNEENPTSRNKKKNKRYIPLLITAAALILIISLPTLLINMNNETTSDQDVTILESEEDAEITGFSFTEEELTPDRAVADIELDIMQIIPENISFELEENDDTLIFILLSDEAEITSTITESILLTAKNHDFQYVQFENMPNNVIEEYNFSEPIEVPID